MIAKIFAFCRFLWNFLQKVDRCRKILCKFLCIFFLVHCIFSKLICDFSCAAFNFVINLGWPSKVLKTVTYWPTLDYRGLSSSDCIEVSASLKKFWNLNGLLEDLGQKRFGRDISVHLKSSPDLSSLSSHNIRSEELLSCSCLPLKFFSFVFLSISESCDNLWQSKNFQLHIGSITRLC